VSSKVLSYKKVKLQKVTKILGQTLGESLGPSPGQMSWADVLGESLDLTWAEVLGESLDPTRAEVWG
jgi:hypothetical protein